MSGLSPAMKSALSMMAEVRERGGEPHGIGANTCDQPYWMDGQAWIDWRTIRALARRGLVKVDIFPGENIEAYLVERASP